MSQGAGKSGKSPVEVDRFEIESEELHGERGGFLRVRRVHLRNHRADGSRSDRYICDFLTRPKGLDAVVVALWHRSDARIRVMLRRALRPVLVLGRPAERTPIPDARRYDRFTEVVAGIIEESDRGESGVRERAAIEVAEEAGYTVSPQAVELLGAGVFPSPGSMPEKFWLTAVHIENPDDAAPLHGDGSPMEEGAETFWIDLDEAIEACVRGDIEDLKTELILRRLRDRLAQG